MGAAILFALKAGVFENYFGNVLTPFRRRGISNPVSKRSIFKKKIKEKKGQNERFQVFPFVISVVFLRVRS